MAHITNAQRKLRNLQNQIASVRSHAHTILEISIVRICKQGSGCNIDGYGAAYKYRDKCDSLAILVGKEKIRHGSFNDIKHDTMKYLVHSIAKKFGVRIDTSPTYTLFVEFLAKLQDAHDDSFDQYRNNGIIDTMQHFLNQCENIKIWLDNAEKTY